MRNWITTSCGAPHVSCRSAAALVCSTAVIMRRRWWCACTRDPGRPELPDSVRVDDIWQQRFESFREHEQHLARNGILVLKFWLNVSREEQRQRFLSRLNEPEKWWKFSVGDVKERAYWDDYMAAYQELLNAPRVPGRRGTPSRPTTNPICGGWWPKLSWGTCGSCPSTRRSAAIRSPNLMRCGSYWRMSDLGNFPVLG